MPINQQIAWLPIKRETSSISSTWLPPQFYLTAAYTVSPNTWEPNQVFSPKHLDDFFTIFFYDIFYNGYKDDADDSDEKKNNKKTKSVDAWRDWFVYNY